MPVYTYRRQDGTTFELRQSFSEDSLTVDPLTGQKVSRVVQNAGVIFKGSGFYKNDNKKSQKSGASGSGKDARDGESAPAKDSEAPKSAEAVAAPEPAKSGETSKSAETPAPAAKPVPAATPAS